MIRFPPARGRYRGPVTRRRSLLFKVFDVFLAVAILAALAVVSSRLDRVSTVNPIGFARVADGDSLTLAGQRIRLRGIDAPELAQICLRNATDYACGRQARQALIDLIGHRDISCKGWERDRYGRLLAICEADGDDLNAAMVSAGWAVSYGGYLSEEGIARGGKRGIWAGTFEQPAEWRRLHDKQADREHDLVGQVLNWFLQLIGVNSTEEGAGNETL